MERDFSIKRVKERIASCNCCSARNYDADDETAIGERVDLLYSVLFGCSRNGSTHVTICPRCLADFRDEITQTLLAEEG